MAIRSLKSGSFSRSAQVGNSIILPGDYESIATVTGNGSSSTITFSSIPSTYKHLQIRWIARQASGGNANITGQLKFNGTSTYYVDHVLQAVNGSVSSNSNQNAPGWNTYINIPYIGTGSASLTSTYGVGIMDIIDYASTSKNKTVRMFYGTDGNGDANTTYHVSLRSGLFADTTAISSITITTSNATAWNTGTTFALYGIRG